MGAHNHESLATVLKRCGRLVDSHIDRLLKEHDIARSQYRVLYHVALRGELTQKQLIDILDVQGSTVTLLVDALVQKGWLVRETEATDKRLKTLSLTAEGRRHFDRIPDPVDDINQLITANLSAAETQNLEAILQKVIKQLR